MKNCGFHCSSTYLEAFVFFSMLAVIVVSGIGGDRNLQCPPFSCGDLHNISYPFRRPTDPPECGVRPWYELSCSNSNAIIRINTGTYYVRHINYDDLSFWVVDAHMHDTNSSCLLPRSDQLPYTEREDYPIDSYGFEYYLSTQYTSLACFVNCSRAITNNISNYKPITCLSTNNSFVYVSACGRCEVSAIEPSCRYLAMIPFGYIPYEKRQNASYIDIIVFIREGFHVYFPFQIPNLGNNRRGHLIITGCLNNSMRYFKEQISNVSILNMTRAFFWSEIHFLECITHKYYTRNLISVAATIVSAIDIPKFILVLCRFILVPLVVFTFLAHKYWKTRITIDAVEKFLRMQQMLGPIRYAYTDIIAITGHFRDKLGQGGYGSVYKGVLLPGHVHVAAKMLNGNSSCNGEEFISEVSTIGRIHHVNVVRLVGFCSEEMRRALVYEYMPRGSLDKYIFSSKKSFSWDKLNEIALGIARGINYLHQGCDMQILHFDIKPHNILLDNNFVPKVADFGLAKLYPRDKSFVPVSAARGTIGYIAPEMISRSFGVISSKSDVYSFGMLLLEMAGGRRNADPNAMNSSQAYYPSRVYSQLTRRETTDEIIDPVDMHELEKKLCIVGLWCIQMKTCDRPTMSEVIDMLEGGTDDLQMPPRPFFCDDDHMPAMHSYHLSSEISAISEEELN